VSADAEPTLGFIVRCIKSKALAEPHENATLCSLPRCGHILLAGHSLKKGHGVLAGMRPSISRVSFPIVSTPIKNET
jgi:hypothetical protein